MFTRPLSCVWLALPIAALLAFASEPAFAQTRIGVVDMQRLLDNAPQISSRRARLEGEFAPRNDVIVKDETRLEEMEQRLLRDGDIMTETERDTLDREIRGLRRDITRAKEDLNEDLQFRLNQELQAVDEEIYQAIRDLAKEQEFDVVLQTPLPYYSDAIDITDEALAKLRSQFESRPAP